MEARFETALRRLRSSQAKKAEYEAFLSDAVERLEKILAEASRDAGDEADVEIVSTRMVPSSGAARRVRDAEQELAERAAERRAARGMVAERAACVDARRTRSGPPSGVPKGHVVVNETRLESEGLATVEQEIARRLHPHQLKGVAFLWNCLVEEGGKLGCILADHMGLGKTIQVAVFLSIYFRRYPNHPVLVICPLSVVSGWEYELSIWSNAVHTYVLVANTPNQDSVIRRWGKDGGVLITNYECFSSQVRDNQTVLFDDREGPALVVVDEGHKIRNIGSLVSKSLRRISTPRRVVLTGYPLQNNLREYWTMLNWACPAYLGTYPEFRTLYEKPIIFGLRQQSSKENFARARRRAWCLHKTLTPCVLRRGMSMVKSDLPPKREFVLRCSTPAIQRRAYIAVIAQFPIFRERVNFNPLVGVYVLRNLAAHPLALVHYLRKIDEGRGPYAVELKKLERVVTEILGHETDWRRLKSGGKAATAMAIVDECLKLKEKVLIFTRSSNVVDVLLQFCQERFGEESTARFDGDTSPSERDEIVAKLNSPSSNLTILVMSIGAGAEGLNLTGASRVILFDVGWNPSHDAQASCRVHRYGQKKPVTVYRLITAGTVEEDMLQLGRAKNGLLRWVVDDEAAEMVHHKEIDWEVMTKVPAELSSYSVDDSFPSEKDDPVLRRLAEMSASFAGGVRVVNAELVGTDDIEEVVPPREIVQIKARTELEDDERRLPQSLLGAYEEPDNLRVSEASDTANEYLALYGEFDHHDEEVVFVKETSSKPTSSRAELPATVPSLGGVDPGPVDNDLSQSKRKPDGQDGHENVMGKRFRPNEPVGRGRGTHLTAPSWAQKAEAAQQVHHARRENGSAADRAPVPRLSGTEKQPSKVSGQRDNGTSDYHGKSSSRSSRHPEMPAPPRVADARSASALQVSAAAGKRPVVGRGRGVGLTLPAWATANGNGSAPAPQTANPPPMASSGAPRPSIPVPSIPSTPAPSAARRSPPIPATDGIPTTRLPGSSASGGMGREAPRDRRGESRHRGGEPRGGQSGSAGRWPHDLHNEPTRESGFGQRGRDGGRERDPRRSLDYDGGRDTRVRDRDRTRDRDRGRERERERDRGRDRERPGGASVPSVGGSRAGPSRSFVANDNTEPVRLGAGRGTSLTLPAWKLKEMAGGSGGSAAGAGSVRAEEGPPSSGRRTRSPARRDGKASSGSGWDSAVVRHADWRGR